MTLVLIESSNNTRSNSSTASKFESLFQEVEKGSFVIKSIRRRSNGKISDLGISAARVKCLFCMRKIHSKSNLIFKERELCVEIDELVRSVRKKQISPEDFHLALNKISHGVKRELRVYKKGVRLHRGRLLNSNPSTISEMSYPPKKMAKVGRANISGCPLFYASAGIPSTFTECRVEINNHIYVGEWECIEPLAVQVIGFSHANPIESLLHEIYTTPSDDMYEYTARISTHLLSGDLINGLLYPSVINMSKSSNFAIKVEYVDKFLRLVNVKLFKVLAITDKFIYESKESDFALPDSKGQLKWQNRLGQWKIDKSGEGLVIISNGWERKVVDLDGCIVDPT